MRESETLLVLHFGMYAHCVFVKNFSECLLTLCKVLSVDFMLFSLYAKHHWKTTHREKLVPQEYG